MRGGAPPPSRGRSRRFIYQPGSLYGSPRRPTTRESRSSGETSRNVSVIEWEVGTVRNLSREYSGRNIPTR